MPTLSPRAYPFPYLRSSSTRPASVSHPVRMLAAIAVLTLVAVVASLMTAQEVEAHSGDFTVDHAQVSPRESVQSDGEKCLKVTMIEGDADNTLHLVNAEGQPLGLTNRDIGKSIEWEDVNVKIFIRIDGTSVVIKDEEKRRRKSTRRTPSSNLKTRRMTTSTMP